MNTKESEKVENITGTIMENNPDYEKLNDALNNWRKELERDKKKVEEKKPMLGSDSIELNVRLPDQNEDDGVTLKDILTIFRRGSVKIFTVTLISVVVGIVVALIYYFVTLEYVGSVTGIISYNYKGAESGLDPYGRTLDVTKIRSPQVLDRVLTELDLIEKGVTVEDIRQNISIGEIVPEDAMQRILIIKEIATKDPSKLEQLNDLSYIATQYAITLNIPKKFSFLKRAKGTELLSAIFASYREYFFEEYGDKDILSTAIASLPYAEYDYDDAHRVLDAQLTNIINYLTAKRSEAPNFRANNTQMSFGDLITNLNLLRTIDLATIRSLVEIRLVSKDKDLLISSYRALISEKILEKNVQTERARITQEAASTYQKDAAVMFGAGGASDSTLQFTQPSDTYDSLIQQAAEASESAIRLQNEIEYYERRIASLQDPLAVSNRAADIAMVEAAIDSVSQKMATWIEIINKTVDEYMETEALKDATKVVLSPQYMGSFLESAKMMAVIVIAVIFIGFMFSTISVYMTSMMKS